MRKNFLAVGLLVAWLQIQLANTLSDNEITFLNETFGVTNCASLNANVNGAWCTTANSNQYINTLTVNGDFYFNQTLPDSVKLPTHKLLFLFFFCLIFPLFVVPIFLKLLIAILRNKSHLYTCKHIIKHNVHNSYFH